MKKDRGFTLVEMIGVIIILIVIFMIMFPALTKMIKNTDGKISEGTIKIIEAGTKDYLKEKSIDYPVSDDFTYCITLDNLIDNANITDKQIEELENKNMIVKVTFYEKNPIFELVETCSIVDEKISFNLIGEKNYSYEVGVGGQYVEQGATALDKNLVSQTYTTTITNKQGTVVTYVDTTIMNTYLITYTSVIDGKTYSIERYVKVVDTTIPTINVNPATENLTLSNTTYNVLSGVTAFDNSGVTPSLTAKTNLSLGQAGTYTVTYTATDKSGNKATATRTIIIS